MQEEETAARQQRGLREVHQQLGRNQPFTDLHPKPHPPTHPGSLLTLSGPGAYDAAVHCAAVSAARRSSLSGSEAGGGDRAQLAPGGGPTGLCPPRVRAPRPSVSGASTGGASTSGGASPRSPSPRTSDSGDSTEPGAGPARPRRSSSGSSSTSSRSVRGGTQQHSPAAAAAPGHEAAVGGRREASGMSLGRKLRNALTEMLITR